MKPKKIINGMKPTDEWKKTVKTVSHALSLPFKYLFKIISIPFVLIFKLFGEPICYVATFIAATLTSIILVPLAVVWILTLGHITGFQKMVELFNWFGFQCLGSIEKRHELNKQIRAARIEKRRIAKENQTQKNGKTLMGFFVIMGLFLTAFSIAVSFQRGLYVIGGAVALIFVIFGAVAVSMFRVINK